MASLDFVQLQNTLKALGFYDFVLPWLLAFAIVFGILQTVGIFKKGQGSNTSVDAVISLAVAFYLTLFTPFPGFLSSFFSKLFGSSIIVLSGVIVLLLFIGIFGFKMEDFFFDTTGTTKKLKGSTYILLIFALILAGGLFFNANSGIFSFGNLNVAGGEILTFLVFFGIIAAVIWFVVHESSPAAEEAAPAGRRNP